MLDTRTPVSVPQNINGRYEIKDTPIGKGGMGVVYKAYDTVTKRYVALKTLWGHVDPAALDLFEREWTVLGRLSHPNIVDILDTGEFRDNGQRKPFFVMPLLPGSTLEELIKTSSHRLTVERIVEVVCQACRGLQAAHDKGLVHRDLKPSNIFVMDDDTVKIIDFGVVHLADTRSATGLKGTLQYMAPEQIDLKPATPISDIFSLGVVCYEALTGRKPFARKTEADTIEAIRAYIPPPASEINAAVNQLLSRTVHKAMAKQPYHRFSSAREFSETLQKALRNEPIDRFDRAKIQPRIERIKKTQAEGDQQFAMEILTELESEGHIDPEMSLLRIQLEQAIRQKTIRQLLESARTRIEEDEHPLALQKVEEVLTIDPDNAEALRLRQEIERRRSENQVENWFRLVRQHLDNQNYTQARQGVEEILKLNSGDTRARELLAHIDRTQREAAKAREDQEKLYEGALACYRNGEISTALSKLERLLEVSRSGLASITPDRDAQYQRLYNQIRSERDAARSAYAEARKSLLDRNFARALEICAENLQKHPGDPLFQALKLETEEAQRQEQSAAVAEINRRVESEPDVDKKYNILKEAVEKYPSEPQFKSSLKFIKERRDLVNSIVARARQYEERGQLNEAFGQWDILKNIYPLYPGLDFEMQRLARRREEHACYEAKAHWVETIDRHLALAEYAKALEIVRQALVEFPGDKELQGLGVLAEQGSRRSGDAASLLSQGQALLAEKKYDEAFQALRRANHLDERNPAVRAALLGSLLQHARDLMARDWRSAEPLVTEALQLDASDPVARSLTSLIEDYKRQEAVSKFITEARALKLAGDIPGALTKVEEGLRAYPNDMRLAQLQSALRAALREVPNPARENPPAATPPPIETIVQPAPAPPPLPANPEAPAPPASTPNAPVATTPVPPPPRPPASDHASDAHKRRLLWGGTALAAVAVILAAVLLPGRHSSPAPSPRTPASVAPAAPPPVPANAPPAKPIPAELRLTSDLKSGALVIDNAQPMELQSGGASVDLPPGDHAVKILKDGKEAFAFAVHADPNQLIGLTSAPKGTTPGIVISSLGDSAKVYATPGVKGSVADQPLAPIPADGISISVPQQTGAQFTFADASGKLHTVTIDYASEPVVAVALSGIGSIPVIITANVPTATILLNQQPLKRPLVNGVRTLPLPPGTYTVALKSDGYLDSPPQKLQIKADQTTAKLNFTLAAIPKIGMLQIDAAPPDSEVLVDDHSIGNVGANSTFTHEINPGTRSIVIRNAKYEEFSATRDFKAGETVKLTPVMRALGAIEIKVTPANARVSVKRLSDGIMSDQPNNSSVPERAGDYTVSAIAENYATNSKTVTVEPGKTVAVELDLKPNARLVPTAPTPELVFTNGAAWTEPAGGWWVHDAKGYSLFRKNEGDFVINILRPDSEKKLFSNKVKKVNFVADLQDQDNRVLYTLDAHHLVRKIVLNGKTGDEKKIDHGMEGSVYYVLLVHLAPDSVVIKNGNGKVLDVIKRSTTVSKFGFIDEVALTVR